MNTATLNFQASVETQEVIRLLEKHSDKQGNIVTYEELSQAAMGDVQAGKRHALTTARKTLLKSNKLNWHVVRGVGVKLLTDAETVKLSGEGHSRIKNIAKRNMLKLTTVEFDSLSKDDQVKHNTNMSVYGVMVLATKPSKVKMIEDRTRMSVDLLPIEETLSLFKASK